MTYAQAKYNSEIGISYCMANAEYKKTTRYFNENTGLYYDSLHTERIQSKGGFGGVLGHHFPIIKMGDYSAMSVSISFMYDALLWESNAFSYSYNSSTNEDYSTSGTVRMSLPVGVDYKFGCDAVADKSRRFTASLGAGVFPSLSGTVFRDEANGNFKVSPYLKGEIGIFAGICMKLRGMLTFGNVKYIDYNYDNWSYNTSSSLTGKSTFTLSLIFMPASFKWKKDEWWGR